jgi:uncharacterized protein (DUF2236 family)
MRKPIEPGTRLWEDTGLVTFSLTTGAAFALQVMHPSVGAVVGEHSVFRTDAIGRAERSIASVLTWVYGGPEALVEADRLRTLHAPLRTTTADGVEHKALSSGPWAWILLTAPYAYTVAARYFSRRPLTRADEEAFYAEIQQLMRNLHVAEKEIPASYADYLARFEEVLAGTLVAHPTAHEFLAATRRVPPPVGLPAAMRPLWRVLADLPGRVQHFVTVGTLPPRAREILGLHWSARDERRLRLLGRTVALTMMVLPERLRYLPIAYRARRANQAQRALQRELDRRPR